MDEIEFGAALRRARKQAGMTQEELAEASGTSKQSIALIEGGTRGVQRNPTIVREFEKALGLSEGELAQYLPEDHPARQMIRPIIPIHGCVGAGPARQDSTPEELLDLGALFAGCQGYRVQGDSMIEDGIRDGDFVLVKIGVKPKVGDIVVAFIADTNGHVVKKLGQRGHLVSANWSYRLGIEDQIFGVLAGVIRVSPDAE